MTVSVTHLSSRVGSEPPPPRGPKKLNTPILSLSCGELDAGSRAARANLGPCRNRERAALGWQLDAARHLYAGIVLGEEVDPQRSFAADIGDEADHAVIGRIRREQL